MGNVVLWKPASTAMLSRLLPDAAVPGGRAAGRRDQPRLRLRRRRSATSALASRDLAGIHFTGSTGVFNGMWQTVGRRHRPLPQLPADRRRDRRQGLHRRPPLRRPRRAGGRDRPRVVRVPGPEVLGRLARLRAVEPLAGAARAARSRRSRRSRWATSPTSRNFMGAVIDAGSFETQREAIEEARAHDETEIVVGGGTDDSTRLLRRADRDRDARPELPAAARRALRPGRDDVRLRRGRWDDTLDLSTRPRRTA